MQVAGSPCLGGSDRLLPGCHQLHAIHPALSRCHGDKIGQFEPFWIAIPYIYH